MEVGAEVESENKHWQADRWLRVELGCKRFDSSL